MKKFFVAIAALVALITTQAFAADMALKAPPPATPAWSWTGYYGGFNGGYGWNRSTGDTTCIAPGGVVGGGGCFLPNSGIVRPQGGLFGGQVGYNWQSNAIVWGLETDIQWSSIKKTSGVTDFCCTPAPVAAGTDTASANLQWFGTVRARAGILATQNTLLYITGGLIYGHESLTSVTAFPLVTYTGAGGSTRAGGIAGAGIEYAFSPSLSGKIEGLWYDMGSANTAFTSPVTTYTDIYHYRFEGGIVRGGLNWKFNGLFAAK
jgi:outer membrane immunogenic protein